MFIVLLEFTGDRGKATELAEAHGEWIARGFDDGAFAEGVVNARILELAPWRADARLSFLVEEAE